MERALGMGEVGIQVAAYLNGEQILDESVGSQTRGGAPVDHDSLFAVFSVTKAIVATALHVQAERGLIEYSKRVADYWPEFAKNGKESTTIADVLAHRAGIPQMPRGVTPERMLDWDWMIAQIEEFEPLFTPGTTNAYHELVWGWLVGELIRRTDHEHRPVDQFLAEEICGPLGVENLYLGVPADKLAQIVPVISQGPPVPSENPYFNDSMPMSVFPGPAVHNQDVVRRGVVPGAGVIMNASSGSRFFALLAGGGEFGGVRLLSEERVRSFAQPRPDAGEVDKVMGWVAWVGVGGYWLGGECPPAYPILGSNAHVLAHPGIGGSISWADPDSHLAVSICHNWMQPDEVQGSIDPHVNPFMNIAGAVRNFANTQH
jgi:CubicO group peptidase (beta-lactamase class C family)